MLRRRMQELLFRFAESANFVRREKPVKKWANEFSEQIDRPRHTVRLPSVLEIEVEIARRMAI